ncbi:MAG: FAD-dependent oxidoreductase [Nocardioidaceae bacterium]
MDAELLRRDGAPRIVVVGAGVSGLTCAVCLLEAGAEVVVRTAGGPLGTVSAVAGAMVGPVFGDPSDPSVAWAVESDRRFRDLAGDDVTGVSIRRGRLLSTPALGPGLPPWAQSVPGFAPCAAADLPPGFPGGFWAELPFVDMPRYLAWLVDRVGQFGGRIEPAIVTDLAGAARMYDGRADVVVNCAGLGAVVLAGDDALVPVRGQHVIVDAPHVREFVFEGGAAGTVMGVFPHRRRVVLGGVSQLGRVDLTPDPADTAGILERCIAALPALAGAPVIGVEVGLRPGRPSVRLERELRGDVAVVHDYGHEGNGVMLSWGCARDVVALSLGPAVA